MYPNAYLEYLIYFHTNRDFFECHEVLEEYWKDEVEQKEIIWVGLIQLAVSLYHYRRGNLVGALKLARNAKDILTHEPVLKLGIDPDSLENKIENLVRSILNEEEYKDFNLPISDEKLLNQCKAMCKENRLLWGAPSNLNDEYIINKHTLRDRSEVIEERLKQKQLRGKK